MALLRGIERKLHTAKAKIPPIYEDEFRRNHIETDLFQKTLLGVGSAIMAILDPRRGDMIAAMGEALGGNAIQHIKRQMEESHEGSEILKNRPRIHSQFMDLNGLKKLPEGTLGKTYSNWLVKYKCHPDERAPVQFVDNVENAYIMQRYRDVHDLFHSVLGMPTNMLGECTVKWVEAIQTHLPMCIGGALFGAIRLKPKHRALYKQYYLPWAIKTGHDTSFLMNIYFEKRWEQPLHELQAEINLKPLVLPSKK